MRQSSRVTSPTTKWQRDASPSLAAFARACSTSASLTSTPSPHAPVSRAIDRSTRPSPQPTSSTTSEGPIPASATTLLTNPSSGGLDCHGTSGWPDRPSR
eukprot:4928425-Prymnesium_polylepis.1